MPLEQRHKSHKPEWRVDDYIERLRPHRADTLSECFTASSRKYFEEKDITDDMLIECYTVMAHIVKAHGDHYLPIFERLHSEIENRNAKRKLLDTALQVSKNSTLLPS